MARGILVMLLISFAAGRILVVFIFTSIICLLLSVLFLFLFLVVFLLFLILIMSYLVIENNLH
jgi:hypothetical protein